MLPVCLNARTLGAELTVGGSGAAREFSQKNLDDTLSCVAIPELRYLSALGLASQDFPRRGHDPYGILADQLVRSFRDCDGSLCVFAKR